LPLTEARPAVTDAAPNQHTTA